MDNAAEPLIFYIVFLFSVTLHEAAHAWAAKLGGDETAYLGGQVTLDPLPHIRRAPIGMVVLPIVTVATTGWPFGFASAPYDPDWARRHPRRAALMALAGPGSNLGLMLLAALVIRVGLSGPFLKPDAVNLSEITVAETSTAAAFAMMVSVLFSMNLILFVLNMLPLPPLDGSAAVPLLLSSGVAERYLDFIRQPMFGWVGILVAWQLFDKVFVHVFLFAVNLLYPGAHYMQSHVPQ